MTARVMLINPPPHRRVDQYDEPDFTRLALATLAGELRAAGTGPLELVDAKFERLDDSGALARIKSFRPDVVGLTAMTNEIMPAARLAEAIKRLSSSIVTVIGGTHVTVLPEETLAEFPSFDHGVIGEGEITLRELVSVLAAGGDPKTVAGVVTRSGNEPHRTSPQPQTPDLDSLADPAWDLLPPSRRYLLSTQRGCPHHCPFCVNPNGREVRKRSVERVVGELRHMAGRGGRMLYVCDEVFTLDGERTHRLLDAIADAGLHRQLEWTAATQARHVDREILVKMKAAGCVLCEVGIETGDEEKMRALGKGLSLEEVRRARRDAADVGIPFGALMILGHPDETWESARKTIDLAVELNPDQTIFGIMVPFPGTEVARMAAAGEHGYRLIAKDWNDYSKQHGNALELQHLTRVQLERLQLFGYIEVLARNGRYRDLARFAWTFRREGWSIARKLLVPALLRGD